jgi:hypothetical protein
MIELAIDLAIVGVVVALMFGSVLAIDRWERRRRFRTFESVDERAERSEYPPARTNARKDFPSGRMHKK